MFREATDHVRYPLLHQLQIFIAVHRLLESRIRRYTRRLAHDVLMTQHRGHTSGRAAARHVAAVPRHYSARRAFRYSYRRNKFRLNC